MQWLKRSQHRAIWILNSPENGILSSYPMNYEQYARSYKTVSIETASPGKLILMLFDGALRFLDAALDGFEIENDTRRNETVNNNILRAQSIIAELQSCLDLSVDGELPMTLYRLYDFVYDQLQKANLKKSRRPLRVAEDILSGIRESWAEMLSKAEKRTPEEALV